MVAGAMDRREFLKGSTAAVVTLGLSPWLVASVNTGSTWGEAEFQALLHQWFHVGSSETGWNAVELVEVRDDGSSARAEQFSVVFQGAPGLTLPEGTFAVVPPAGDAFEIFLQPTGGDASGTTFAARFSLLRIAAPSCAQG